MDRVTSGILVGITLSLLTTFVSATGAALGFTAPTHNPESIISALSLMAATMSLALAGLLFQRKK